MTTTESYSAYSFLLERTARRVKQFAQSKFNELQFEITVDQWSVLKNLYHHRNLSQAALAELVFKDQPTLTRILDLLCKKELVERRAHPTDRRCFTVHLTPAGTSKVEQLLPEVNTIREKAWENLSPKDFEHFKKVLDTIYTNLEI
jgi:DNA-binding MarR family transcriptional regulator